MTNERCAITMEQSPEFWRKLYADTKPYLMAMTDAEKKAFNTEMGYNELDKVWEALGGKTFRT